MYRLQAALVLFMAAVSVLGYFIVPAKNSRGQESLQPASSVQSVSKSELDLKQKLAVRDQLLANAHSIESEPSLFLFTDGKAYSILERNTTHWIVALGEKGPSRFSPKTTLRIWKSGQIDEQTSSGEWQTISR